MRDASHVFSEESRLLLARQRAAGLAADWAVANRRRPAPEGVRRNRATSLGREDGQHRLRSVRLAVARFAISLGRAIRGPEAA